MYFCTQLNVKEKDMMNLSLIFATIGKVAEDVADEVASQVTEEATQAASNVVKNITGSDMHIDEVMSQLIAWSMDAGRHILVALVVYIIGHYIVKFINHLLTRVLERRKIEVTLQSFLKSFVNITLQILLIISVVGALGINTTSFAALLASVGVAVGMALSGNLQNFAGGIIILFLKPYKVGDWIEAQGVAGTVKSIQIFHTVIEALDGKLIHLPNGALSSGNISNYSQPELRQVEWVIGVEYGTDVEKARQTVTDLFAADGRVLTSPAPVIWLKMLNSSSVDLVIRAWVKNADYWGVLFGMNEQIYNKFNEKGIKFPFPQVTVHQG